MRVVIAFYLLRISTVFSRLAPTFLGLSALAVCAFSGCAYRAGYGDRQIPGGYRTIAVPVFKNMTHETGAEVYFTNAMIRELERARVGVVTNKEDAQVTLEGSVDSIDYVGGSPEKFLSDTAVLNRSVQIIAGTTLRLRRNSDQKVLWESAFRKELGYASPFIVQTEALTSVNALYNHSARHQNLEVIAADMMVEAHDRLTENF